MNSRRIAGAGGAAVAIAAFLDWRYNIRNRIVRITGNVVPSRLGDPKNTLVTQGRPQRASGGGIFYSGCGDLWNYVLAEIRAPLSWINRDIPGYAVWKPEINISKPYGAALKSGAWTEWKPGLFPKRGDLMMIGRDHGEMTHVLVVVYSDGKGHIRVMQYGGANNSSTIGEGDITSDGRYGSRHVAGWIDAEKIPHGVRWEKAA